MVKKLLLLAFITVAGDAMAQDAQCVGERAAMIDTIRAYARSEPVFGSATGFDAPSILYRSRKNVHSST